MCWRTEGGGAGKAGQATVEAAFMIPVLFVMLLMLVQPGIILYDRVVMNHAAAEGCRLLATSTSSAGMSQDQCREIVKRHLGAIPPQELFHVHDGGCSYRIEVSGTDASAVVAVKVTNRVKLLPLFDVGARLAGVSPDGYVDISVSRSARTKPDWLGVGSSDPGSWVHLRD